MITEATDIGGTVGSAARRAMAMAAATTTTTATAAVVVAAAASAMACRRMAASPESPEAGLSIPAQATWGGLTVRTAGERRHPRQVVVLLHGWGAPGDDLVPLASPLAAPGRLFVFPAAPLVGPGGGRAWWHLDLAALESARAGGHDRDLRTAVPAGLPEARAHILSLLAEVEHVTRLPRSSVVLGGFSQGAMLAIDAALASAPRPGAIVAMSGTLLSESAWTAALADGGKPRIPVFLSHGSMDPVLPFRLAVALRDLLTTAGYPVTWVPFDGGHGIPPVVMNGLNTFLRAP